MRRLGVLGVISAMSLGASATARASELITLTTTSSFVDPAKVTFNGADHPKQLRVNVLLPDDYDPSSTYPVLYLLHGVGDAYDDWADKSKGDVANVAKGFPGIIVMPEGARGFYTDWFNDGRRGDPGWESYDLRELIPFVEGRFPIRAGRRWHAIAGFSMGGFGATYLATQRPGYFGAAMSSQGFVSTQRPEVEIGLQAVAQVSYTDVFGPRDGFYATGHNPSRLTDNLRSTRLYVTVGDGTDPERRSSPTTALVSGPEEAALRLEADDLVAASRASGVGVTYLVLPGVHDWPFRRDHLHNAIAWGFFKPVSDHPSRWTYRTVTQHGEMWGLRFEFIAAPEEVETFRAAEGRLAGGGSGTVTIHNDAGCGFTAELPFDVALPPDACIRLSLRVKPTRARAGRPTRFRFVATAVRDGRRVGVPNAVVKLGSRRARTDRHGRAVIVARLAPNLGARHPSVRAAGLLSGRTRIRVSG
jgi:S-formylglutathione hydrolase FrmB